MNKPSPEHPEHRLSCLETLRQINEYIDGELAEDLCQEIERHMAHCSDCRLMVDTLSKTVRLYRSLARVEVELPPDVEQRLLSRLNP
jgi:anti-sigma factor (TIGR02949 family)